MQAHAGPLHSYNLTSSMASKIQHEKGPTLGLVHISLQDNDDKVLKDLKFYRKTPLGLLRMYVTKVLLWSGYLYFHGTLIGPKFKQSLESLKFKSDTAVFKLRRYKMIQGQLQDLKLHLTGKGTECTLHDVPSSCTVDLLKFMIECEHEIPMQKQVFKFKDKKWIHDSKPSYICARRELVEDNIMTVDVTTNSPTVRIKVAPGPMNVIINSVEVSTSSPKTGLKSEIMPFIALNEAHFSLSSDIECAESSGSEPDLSGQCLRPHVRMHNFLYNYTSFSIQEKSNILIRKKRSLQIYLLKLKHFDEWAEGK